MDSHNYNVDLNWSKNKQGFISSPSLNTSIEVATPLPFPGGVDNLWSPEHLFTAAVNSCFMTTFLSIAENSKLAFTEFTCTAIGKLEKVEGKYQMTEVMLEPRLTLVNKADFEKAGRILLKAEQHCLISNSIKSKVGMNPQLIHPKHEIQL